MAPFTRKQIQFADTVDTETDAQVLERRFQERAAADPNGRMPLWVLAEEWWDSKPRLAATTVMNCCAPPRRAGGARSPAT